MIKAAVITTLCIPMLCAAQAVAYEADLQASLQQADAWQANLTQVDAELAELGVDLSAPAGSAALPETEDTVAVADLGLLFDTANSRIIYLGNVRLRDARAHLNAAEQLHIYLQSLTDGLKSDASDDNPDELEKADAPDAEEEAESPEPAEPVEVPGPTPEETSAGNTPQTPAVIDTNSAIADSNNNAILLHSPAGGKDIRMQHGGNEVRITPGSNSPARLLADPQGNVLMEGRSINIRLTDKEGKVSTLQTAEGLLYYHAATHTLHAPGSTIFTSPDGSLRCSKALSVVLQPAEQTKPQKSGFMSQFTGLRFDGIATATAQGQVVLSGEAREGRPAVQAEGDTLTYNGQTGECALEGGKCRLCYGAYDIHTDQGIHLLSNGDIELRGADIYGTYERESNQPGETLKGKFKAHSTVIFRAELGTISSEKGIHVADSEADFSCTGPAHLVLNRKETTTHSAKKNGMPNLAIANFGDVKRARATGNVIAHRYEPGTGKCVGELKAASVESDLETGETLLTGEPGEPLVAHYEGSSIVATPEAGQAATMQLLANGDLLLSGNTIDARMVNTEGTTTARCNSYVRLIQADGRLETGSATELHAPKAILTTKGHLQAKLAASKKSADASPRKAKGFTNFRFDFDGIEEATTQEGCTLRTEQGSMQCTGPVRIVMDNSADAQNSDMGGIKYATASGNVAIAGKDGSGRMMRATGDRLTIDSATGMKVLSGNRVTVGDADNTHIITGADAAIRIDARNNVTMVGSKHKTHASNVRQQLEDSNNKKTKK